MGSAPQRRHERAHPRVRQHRHRARPREVPAQPPAPAAGRQGSRHRRERARDPGRRHHRVGRRRAVPARRAPGERRQVRGRAGPVREHRQALLGRHQQPEGEREEPGRQHPPAHRLVEHSVQRSARREAAGGGQLAQREEREVDAAPRRSPRRAWRPVPRRRRRSRPHGHLRRRHLDQHAGRARALRPRLEVLRPVRHRARRLRPRGRRRRPARQRLGAHHPDGRRHQDGRPPRLRLRRRRRDRRREARGRGGLVRLPLVGSSREAQRQDGRRRRRPLRRVPRRHLDDRLDEGRHLHRLGARRQRLLVALVEGTPGLRDDRSTALQARRDGGLQALPAHPRRRAVGAAARHRREAVRAGPPGEDRRRAVADHQRARHRPLHAGPAEERAPGRLVHVRVVEPAELPAVGPGLPRRGVQAARVHRVRRAARHAEARRQGEGAGEGQLLFRRPGGQRPGPRDRQHHPVRAPVRPVARREARRRHVWVRRVRLRRRRGIRLPRPARVPRLVRHAGAAHRHLQDGR